MAPAYISPLVLQSLMVAGGVGQYTRFKIAMHSTEDCYTVTTIALTSLKRIKYLNNKYA